MTAKNKNKIIETEVSSNRVLILFRIFRFKGGFIDLEKSSID